MRGVGLVGLALAACATQRPMPAGDTTFGERKATITEANGRWTLENGALSAVVVAASGTVDLASFYNKLAGVEYLGGAAGARRLFRHHVVAGADEVDVDSADGSWQVTASSTTDIVGFDKTWGKRLALTVSRAAAPALTIELDFEIYDDTAGLRYQTSVTNDAPAGTMLRLDRSDVLSLDLSDAPRIVQAAVDNLDWIQPTQPVLTDGRRNLVAVYGPGHGFGLNLESNYSTSLGTGPKPIDRVQTGDQRHSFLSIDGWNAQPSLVTVSTDPVAVKLGVLPGETVEYFAVDLSVFRGDAWDARMAIAEQLRARYQFVDPSRVISVDDWLFAGSTKQRDDGVYRASILPALAAAGVDRLLIDDFWNCDATGASSRSSTTACRLDANPAYTFTNDLPAFAADVGAAGLAIGYWWSLTGQQDAPSDLGFGGGADLSDPAVIDARIATWKQTFLPEAGYRAKWQQVDLGEIWLNPSPTPHATVEDSVYRKWLGVRRYLNAITHAPGQSDFLMQTTCELDNGRRGAVYPDGTPHWESLGLLALADNGIAGLFWGEWTVDPRGNIQDTGELPRSAVKTAFAYLGVFPSEGMYDYYPTGAWSGDAEQLYQHLLSRHVGIYQNPAAWTPEQIARFRRFNDWRKSPRIRSLLAELLRPVFNSATADGLAVGAHDDPTRNDGPYAWMFTDRPRTQALLVAVGGATTTNLGVRQFKARLRWLDPAKTYFVTDVSLAGDGFANQFAGTVKGGAAWPVDFGLTGPRAKAFWISEMTNDRPHVIYADHAIYAYSETLDGAKLTVTVTSGVPGATATVVVWQGAGLAETHTLVLDGNGAGTLTI